MNYPLLAIEIRYEQDVVQTRQRARQIAARLGFTPLEQTAFATAVSEIARNAFRYAGHGRVGFACRTEPRPSAIVVEVGDKGSGITDLNAVLEGRYKSETGMGLGILGAKRLSDEFEVRTVTGGGTTVVLGKRLPKNAPDVTPQLITSIASELAQRTERNPLEEVQQQNKELMRALDDLRARQAEVERLNTELEETNRGVVALYAELDEKADSLRQASEYKSRFLSDMTHELRTPLNAIVSLSRLLLDRADGELTPEQEKQATYIHRSAASLGEMVNDLLDLAKIEAGKTDLHVSEIFVPDLLAAVRGMFRPLVVDPRVTLTVDDPNNLPRMTSDERKLSQVLRNLISNALKFTESGEVRVTAEGDGQGRAVFKVCDTGIGIAPEHLGMIFGDFTQIDSGVQRRVQGTGLGLPLTRKLVQLLGGEITVSSTVGVGSIFTVTVPTECERPVPEPAVNEGGEEGGGTRHG